jgi:hypothetical protein
MGDASRSAETPHTVEKTDYKLNLRALVPKFVATLTAGGSSKTAREKAKEGLTQICCDRMSALAEYIDHTAAGRPILLNGQLGQLENTLGAALFLNRTAFVDASDFYQRAAAAIREWLIARLEELVDSSEETTAVTRFRFWRQFHQNAANLPEHIRAVHDLMYYFRLTAHQTAEVLRKPLPTVELDRDVALYMLRPMFDQARGKA